MLSSQYALSNVKCSDYCTAIYLDVIMMMFVEMMFDDGVDDNVNDNVGDDTSTEGQLNKRTIFNCIVRSSDNCTASFHNAPMLLIVAYHHLHLPWKF